MPFRNANWKFGDQAPAETAWRRSSAYPFSVTKLMALCKPAKFFGLFFDNSRLTKNISNQVQEVLIEMIFQLGIKNLKRFKKFNKFINKKDK